MEYFITPKFLRTTLFFRRRKFVVLFTILLILIVLSFYYLPLSQLLKKVSPLKTEEKSKMVFAPKIQPLDYSVQNKLLVCPLPKEFCKDQQYFKESSFSAKPAKNTPIYAAFDGEAESLISTHNDSSGNQEEFTLLLLTNKIYGLQAFYYFKGNGVERNNFLAGERIATSSGEPLRFLKNQTFAFELIKTATEGGKMAKLSPKDFK